MKALTIWQPHARLIADGRKRFETRSWETDYRGLIAIHAAKRWQSEQQETLTFLIDRFPATFGDYAETDLPFGEMLCICRLVSIQKTENIRSTLTDEERAAGDYADGRFAWELEHVMTLSPGIAVRGRQKLWNWTPPAHLFEKHVAIVGSRSLVGDRTTFEAIRDTINNLPPDTTLVSGNARGVDRNAERLARGAGLNVISLPVPSIWWDSIGSRAGMVRNNEILELSSKVFAFWDGRSSGTRDTIKKARKRGIPTIVNPHEIPDGRHAWAKAVEIAKELARVLEPACEWIQIAGSIRRRKNHVGDCEIVLTPKLFPEFLQQDAVAWLLDTLVQRGIVERGDKWGSSYRKVVFGGMKFDVFWCDEWNRGSQYQIRTGPGDMNTLIMTEISRRNAPFRHRDGYVWADAKKLKIDTEEKWFALLGLPYLKPSERTADRVRDLFKSGHHWGNPKKYIPQLRQQQLATDDIGMYDEGKLIDVLVRNGRLSADPSPEPELYEWAAPWVHKSGKVWVWDGEELYEDYQTGEQKRGKTFKLVDRDSDEAHSARRRLSGVFRDPKIDDLYRYLDYQRGWQPIPDELYFEIGDLPAHYALLREERQEETVALCDIRLTQKTYHPWIVRQYKQTGHVLDREGKLPYGIRFNDTPILLLNGTHRFMRYWFPYRYWMQYDADDIEACRRLFAANKTPFDTISDDRLREMILENQIALANIQMDVSTIPMTVREAHGHLPTEPREHFFADVLDELAAVLESAKERATV